MHDWPHSPLHRLFEKGTYIVTAGTYLKQPFFRGAARLDFLCEKLLEVAEKHQWHLQAWAVFPNHYHFVATSPNQGALFTALTRHFHSVTSIQANRWDQTPGRKVWYQYWETLLTSQKSYLVRLGYVHRNAMHHQLVREPSAYRWCSAGWFESRATSAFYNTVMGMKIDRVNVPDEFVVEDGEAV
jgi:REP-associated tyrosine transposase